MGVTREHRKRKVDPMSTRVADFPETVAPNEEEARLARESSRRLASFLTTGRSDFRLGIRQDDRREESVAIPASAFRLLVDILTEMGREATVRKSLGSSAGGACGQLGASLGSEAPRE